MYFHNKMTTKKERENFVNKMRLQLELCDYGFQKTENSTIASSMDEVITIQKAKKMRAVKELLIRMNLYVDSGRHDQGKIDFPEANRVIHYRFDDKSIKNCKLNMLVK